MENMEQIRMKNNHADDKLVEVVNKKMTELLQDGWFLNVARMDKPVQFFKYFEFVQYNRNGYIEDVMAIGVVKKVKGVFEYGYVVQIIDNQDCINEEVKVA